ncbi:MAG: glycosyl transferase family 1 [Spirochaetaceae bacterium]
MSKEVPDLFTIGIVCGKLGDVDGVSLEVDKWVRVLLELGHEVYTFAGRYAAPLVDIPVDHQITVKEIRFASEKQLEYERQVFPYLQNNPPRLSTERKQQIIEDLEHEGNTVANELFSYIQNFSIDVIVAQNTNAMPMSLIGGMAVYKLATQRRVATIFHHHDFWWERSRFSRNYIEQLLGRIMPPADPGLEHVVLSSYAEHILRSIKRVLPKVIPNCENFSTPVSKDEYNSRFREELGFSEEDILVIQPTRVVRRKRIEDSLELIGRLISKYPELQERVKFIISLYQGDEPDIHYIDEINSIAEGYAIPLYLISDRVTAERCTDEEGRIRFTNRDVLANADLVTYLPVWEGFGNALLEAIAARVPVVTTEYLVYKTDIKVVGFKNIEIRDRYDRKGKLIIPEEAIEEIYRILTHPQERRERVDYNFDLGKKEFGLDVLKEKLSWVLDDYGDEIRASRKRIEKSKRVYPV